MAPAPVHNSVEIDAAITELAGEPGGGLIMVPDVFNDANHEQIITLVAQRRLPAIYPHRFDDALITYGPDLPDLFGRAASYVDRIKPADLPVQAPTKYELVINLKTAKALGIEVPNSIQLLADEVIE
jgi:putative tryptophan/tyrosine transport system substrate-binding protein